MRRIPHVPWVVSRHLTMRLLTKKRSNLFSCLNYRSTGHKEGLEQSCQLMSIWASARFRAQKSGKERDERALQDSPVYWVRVPGGPARHCTHLDDGHTTTPSEEIRIKSA
ncbi:uncharacterized protein [Periplaneta americana]|uniref:uncharacterized protein n=1 Tax=Periplaneta americana TaxID=6978 RepID=UPI0037E74A9D